MSIETELKLRIASEHLNRLKRHPLLKTLSTARVVTRKLHSVYYDTPDLELYRRAMALRLRRVGGQWLQTMKGGGGVQAGLHQRNEWETPVEAAALDFGALEACGGQRLPAALRKKLQPLFVTDFSRTTRMLLFEGAEIELCMDSGEIRAGQASRPISELELELKSGEPQQLFRLALALLDIVPLAVEHTSKAEYGYRLCAHSHPAVTSASTPDMVKYTDVPGALQAMIWSCLLHLQANVPGAVQKLDEEYLHQVRVALRRLRAVLAMTVRFRADKELGELRAQVAELGAELGRMREWDVFVTQTLMPICAHLPDQPGLRALLLASEKLRREHHAAVKNILQSQDYQRFLLRFGAWMHGGYWRRPVGADLTLTGFAAQILDKRRRQVGTRAKHLALADSVQLHRLRIACKKLRYSAELFVPLFDPAQTKSYLSALSLLQDILGKLNDLTVAQSLLDELDAGRKYKYSALVRERIACDYTKKLVKLGKAWKKLGGKKALGR